MLWVRWLGVGVVLSMAVFLAVSVTATPAPSLPAVVVLEGESAPETSPPTGPVVVPPSVVGLGEPTPEEPVGDPSEDEIERDDGSLDEDDGRDDPPSDDDADDSNEPDD
jgi:hypothetical protein